MLSQKQILSSDLENKDAVSCGEGSWQNKGMLQSLATGPDSYHMVCVPYLVPTEQKLSLGMAHYPLAEFEKQDSKRLHFLLKTEWMWWFPNTAGGQQFLFGITVPQILS